MRSQHTLVAAILAVVPATLLVIVGAYKTHLNELRYSRFRERDARIKATDALGQEAVDLVRIALFERVSIDEFRREFGSLSDMDGAPDAEPSTRTYRYVHPASRYAFALRFSDDILTGFNGLDSAEIPIEPESREFLLSESVRTGVLRICVVLWLAVLIGALTRPRWRRAGSVSLILLSVLCFLAWFLAPNYGPTWRAMSSNDSLARGLLMFGVSLAVGLSTGHPSCIDRQTNDA
jgi:hypothetical protein